MRPELYAYENYRLYLKETYQHLKQTSLHFTYAKFSQKAQIKSPNILKLVIDGKKNLTSETILKFAKALSLNSDETPYFEALVMENQALGTLEKAYYSRRRKSLRQESLGKVIKVTPKQGIFESPLLPAIVVLISDEPEATAAQKVSRELGIHLDKAKKLIARMFGLGIFSVQEGRYVLHFDHAIFHQAPTSVQLKSFHREQLKISSRALARRYEKEAKFFSHSMGIEQSRYEEFIDDLDAFVRHINTKYSTRITEQVLQFNAQCFWLNAEVLS